MFGTTHLGLLMSEGLKVTLPIEAVPKGRPRGRIVNLKTGKQFIQWYTTKETREFEESVRKLLLLQNHKVLGPVELRVTFRLTRPKSVSVKKRPLPCVMPDLDNLVKSVLDATQNVIFENDAVMCRLVAEKMYCGSDEWPSIEIEVLPMLVEKSTLFKKEA